MEARQVTLALGQFLKVGRPLTHYCLSHTAGQSLAALSIVSRLPGACGLVASAGAAD